jgi:hypothetical protein
MRRIATADSHVDSHDFLEEGRFVQSTQLPGGQDNTRRGLILKRYGEGKD